MLILKGTVSRNFQPLNFFHKPNLETDRHTNLIQHMGWSSRRYHFAERLLNSKIADILTLDKNLIYCRYSSQQLTINIKITVISQICFSRKNFNRFASIGANGKYIVSWKMCQYGVRYVQNSEDDSFGATECDLTGKL